MSSDKKNEDIGSSITEFDVSFSKELMDEEVNQWTQKDEKYTISKELDYNQIHLESEFR